MKKIMLTLSFMIYAAAMVFAQFQQGNVLVGTTTSLWGGMTAYSEMLPGNSAGLSYTVSKTKPEEGDAVDGPKTMSLNFSPRLGYFIWDDIVAGLKVDWMRMSSKEGQGYEGGKSVLSLLSGGPFLRYYIPEGSKFRPYIETELSWGMLNNKFVEENGNENYSNKTQSFHLGANAGLAVVLGDKLTFDFLAGYFRNVSKDPDADSEVKHIVSGIGVGVGFSILLN